MTLFIRLSWFFRTHYKTYAASLLMLLLVGLLNTSIPWLVGHSIDTIVAADKNNGDLGKLPLFLLTLIGAGAAIYLMRIGWRALLFGTSYRLGHQLRNRFYRYLSGQGQAFFSRHNTGDLMARTTIDIDAIEMAAGEGILSGFDGLLTFILVLSTMLIVIDWQLTIIALIPFPFMAWAFYRVSSRQNKQFHQALESFSDLNNHTQEAMTGIRLVRSMGLEAYQQQTFDKVSRQALNANYNVARNEALYEPIVFLSMGAAMLLGLSFGGWLIANNQLSIGALTSFTLYLGQLIWPMFAFGWLLDIIQRGSAGLTRLEQTLAEEKTVEDSGSETPTEMTLKARQLTFAYPNGEPVLNAIDFTLHPGQLLGIAGPTGTGKTTLLQLVMRYWELPNAGMLTLGDKALSTYSLDALRACFAYVPQDPFLFSLTIAENIALARPDASREEIREAAHIACIAEDIDRFPQGFDTPVGERGITLSGGQRQRLALARALLTRAPVLILDDALSAVDSATEKTILERLQPHMRNATTLIVSHRLSTLSSADQILVLNHNTHELGRHSQLITTDGWYARMWTYQQLEANLDEPANHD